MVRRRLRTHRWKHDVFCVFVQPPYQLCHPHASCALKGMMLFKAAMLTLHINNGLQQAADCRFIRLDSFSLAVFRSVSLSLQ